MAQERFISRYEMADLLGVSLQTVTNWTNKGILRSRQMGRFQLYDRKSVENLADSLQQLKVSHLAALDLQKEYKELTSKMETAIRDFRKGLGILSSISGFEVRKDALKIILSISKRYLDEKSTVILKGIIEGDDLEGLSQQYQLSPERILLIGRRACSKLSRAKDYYTILQQNMLLEKKVEQFEVVCQNQLQKITELEEALEIKRYKDDYQLTDADIRLCELLMTDIRQLPLPKRVFNCLLAAGCNNLSDIVSLHEADLLKLRNFGKKAKRFLINFLDQLDLHLDMDNSFLLEKYRLHQLNITVQSNQEPINPPRI